MNRPAHPAFAARYVLLASPERFETFDSLDDLCRAVAEIRDGRRATLSLGRLVMEPDERRSFGLTLAAAGGAVERRTLLVQSEPYDWVKAAIQRACRATGGERP